MGIIERRKQKGHSWKGVRYWTRPFGWILRESVRWKKRHLHFWGASTHGMGASFLSVAVCRY